MLRPSETEDHSLFIDAFVFNDGFYLEEVRVGRAHGTMQLKIEWQFIAIDDEQALKGVLGEVLVANLTPNDFQITQILLAASFANRKDYPVVNAFQSLKEHRRLEAVNVVHYCSDFRGNKFKALNFNLIDVGFEVKVDEVLDASFDPHLIFFLIQFLYGSSGKRLDCFGDRKRAFNQYFAFEGEEFLHLIIASLRLDDRTDQNLNLDFRVLGQFNFQKVILC